MNKTKRKGIKAGKVVIPGGYGTVAPVHGYRCVDDVFWSSRPLFSLSHQVWNPPVDISETRDRLFVRMEVAGVRPNDLSVSIVQGDLVIHGHRPHAAPAPEEEFHVMEISYGCFERIIRLPIGIIEDGIVARYHDGFLDVEIPKGPTKLARVEIKVHKE